MAQTLWNTKQASKALGITTSGVIGLIARGLLHDVTVRDESKFKHYAKVDRQEVLALKAANKDKSRYMVPASSNGHNVQATEVAPPVEAYTPGPSVPETPKIDPELRAKPMAGINTRLERIEKKLDQLLALWR